MAISRKTILRLLVMVAQKIGSPIRDAHGIKICRAFIYSWRGKVHMLGLPNDVQLIPVPFPEKSLTYFRQSFCWAQAKPPNFPRIGQKPSDRQPTTVCHVVICHLGVTETHSVYDRWTELNPECPILVAYGGDKESFDRLPSSMNAVFIEDETLRTSDHTRERQQYSAILRIADLWIEQNAPNTTHVHLVEYDAAPAIRNVGEKLVEALNAEDADMAGFGMIDLTGTIHPHNRYEISRHDFTGFLGSFTNRELGNRLITMLGCSSIWTRECFHAVASLEPPRTYLEIAMPSLAHHLGYRVRPMPKDQEKFVTFTGDLSDRMETLTREGAWIIHPCKRIWNKSQTPPKVSESLRKCPPK